jgi:hypothetical protein
MQVRARAQRIGQRFGRGAQPLVGEGGHGGGIGRPLGDRLQHPPRARPQQIGHQTRELDVHFLEQRFEPILQLHAATGQLILAARHRAP